MKKLVLSLWLLSTLPSLAQQTIIQGKIVQAISFQELSGVQIQLEASFNKTITNPDGSFSLTLNDISENNRIIVISFNDHITQRIPVNLTIGHTKDLGIIILEKDIKQQQAQMGTLLLSDHEIENENGAVDNIAGILQASKDVFINAAAYDFSTTFFKPRGLDSEYGKLLINGLEMNKIYNARPLWSNWGGLNDVQRNQEFMMGVSATEDDFGGFAGTTNITMRASKYSKGVKISAASTNRTYNGRLMATYNSGEMKYGWYISVSASRRFAEEAYIDGSTYDANAIFVSVEKRFNNNHNLNFTAFYTPTTKGKTSANTKEVLDLKGSKYNSYWGYQNTELRNSRIREVKEPVFMLNHYWEISDALNLNTNLGIQFGKIASTYIDFGGTKISNLEGQEAYIGGGTNPDPAYYQKLPSYFLRFNGDQNYEAAYLAQESFLEEGQLNWGAMYRANELAMESGGNAIYILSENRNDDFSMFSKAILEYKVSDHLLLNSGLSYSSLKSENFASVKDLLGGNRYLDIDIFAENSEGELGNSISQSDLLHPNRSVKDGDRYKYNYNLYAGLLGGFSHLQYKDRNWDAYLAFNLGSTLYQREGKFQNGFYPNSSLGKGEKQNFTNLGGKLGGTYKLNAKNLFSVNAAFSTQAPLLKNTYLNARQNNLIVPDLNNEKILALDLSYRFRAPWLNFRITGYNINILDATEVSYYYANGLSGLGREDASAFVQESLTGIDKQHIGLELGLEIPATSAVLLKAAAGFGQFTYNNNPKLYISSSSIDGLVDYGNAYLKNYRLPSGPQLAAQLGLEYRDPNNWWFGTTANFFSHAYIDVSPLSRTKNFQNDIDGLPILEYDASVAKRLLKQERLDSYILVNAIGGKSWRVRSYYMGVFISLNNILDTNYITGGFEQSRNANYRNLKQDKEREKPLFGNKYWSGYGTTYYANLYVRF